MKGWYNIVALRNLIASDHIDSILSAIRDGIEKHVRSESDIKVLLDIVLSQKFRIAMGKAIDGAVGAVEKLSRDSSYSVGELDDAAQETALMLLEKSDIFHLSPPFVNSHVQAYFYTTVKNMMMWKLREAKEDMVPLHKVRDNREEFIRHDFSGKDVESLLEDLREYVIENTQDDLEKEMFLVWFDLSQMEGREDVDVDDVVDGLSTSKRLWLHGKKIDRRHLYPRWKSLKKRMSDFFESQLNVRLTDSLKKKLHISSVIALEFSRRKVAAWILGLSSFSSAA